MSDVVKVELEVSPEVAQALQDEHRRKSVTALIQRMVVPGRPEDDPLMLLFAKISAEAKAAGLTEEDIESELAAYNAEGRN